MTALNLIADRALRDLEVVEGQAAVASEDRAAALETLLDIAERLALHVGGRGFVDVEASGELTAKSEERIICTTAQAVVTAPSGPVDFARFAVVPLAGDVTLAYNGRKLAGALANTTISSPTTYLYRADLGDWKQINGLSGASENPYPEWTVPYLSIICAAEVATRFSRRLNDIQYMKLQTAHEKIRERFMVARDIDLTDISGATANMPRPVVWS